MTRRSLIIASSAAMVCPSAAAPTSRSLFEMRTFKLRNGPENQRQRTLDYLKIYVTQVKSAGAGPVGVFSSAIAGDIPFLVAITSFKSFADMHACQTRLAADPDHTRAVAAWSTGHRPYERQEVRLLSAFGGFPVMTPPPTEGRKNSRIFELRTYDLETAAALERKIKMFEVGETAIFVQAGMLPVFFAETVYGPSVPSLTYMLGFEDLTAREAASRKSGGDPEWKRLGAEFPDVAVVPNYSISFLSGLAFSDVR